MSLDFFDTTAETVYKTFCENLQKLTGEKFYEGDERLIYAQCLSTVIIALFNTVNERTKARLLRFSYGEILDAIGEHKKCERLLPSKSVCTIRFTTNSAKKSAITIPKGTKVTDGNFVFQTVEKCVIAVGNLLTTVDVECIDGGASSNGIPVGSISTIIDTVIGVTGCTNISVTYGGDDGEPYPYDEKKHPNGDNGEGDEKYRERIRLSNSAYSCAGSEDSYIYWAKTASPLIEDVNVISNKQAGTIELVVMTKDGVPSEDLIEKVLAKCSAKDVRPMNDIVSVIAPELVTYDIEIEYTIKDGNQGQAIEDLTGEKGACNRFAEYTEAKLGRDVNPDLLHHYCMQSATGEKQGAVWGCKVISPTMQVLEKNQVAKWSGKVLLHEPTIRFED